MISGDFEEKGHSIQELLLALENHRGEPSFTMFYMKLPGASRASRRIDFIGFHGYHLISSRFCANGSISMHIDAYRSSGSLGTLFLVFACEHSGVECEQTGRPMAPSESNRAKPKTRRLVAYCCFVSHFV